VVLAQVVGQSDNVSVGSKPVLTAPNRDFRVTPSNGHHQVGPVGPVRAIN
jgi:hypothetical protein